MFKGKEQEEQEEPAPLENIPHQVVLALKVLTLFEYRPAKTVVSISKGSENGETFNASSQWEREVVKKPSELTKEQRALQATACVLLNSYFTDYIISEIEPPEDFIEDA